MAAILIIFMFVAFVGIDFLVRTSLHKMRDAKEREAREKVLNTSVKLDFTHEAKSLKRVEVPNPKARILGEPEGLVKLVCEAGTGRVLGVHLMGAHATDLIAEGALAVQLGATADDLAWTTHAHPTLAEGMLEAALGFREAAIHIHTR